MDPFPRLHGPTRPSPVPTTHLTPCEGGPLTPLHAHMHVHRKEHRASPPGLLRPACATRKHVGRYRILHMRHGHGGHSSASMRRGPLPVTCGEGCPTHAPAPGAGRPANSNPLSARSLTLDRGRASSVIHSPVFQWYLPLLITWDGPSGKVVKW